MKKLDPRLRHLIRQRPAEIPEFSERIEFRQAAEQRDKVEVLVRCVGDNALAQLRTAGISCKSAKCCEVGERLKVKGERKINCFTPCPLPLTLTSASSLLLRAIESKIGHLFQST